MYRHALLRLLCCGVLAAVALGQVKVVTLKSGSQVTGQVVKTDGKYEVTLESGIVVVFSEEDVVSIAEATTPQSGYEKRRAEIDPDDPDDHYRLAEWAYEQDMLEIARRELNAALELKPDHERSRLLLRQVRARLAARTRPASTTGPAEPEPDVPSGMRRDWMLGEEDVYRIRRAELRDTDRVVIKYRNDVIDRFIRRMEGYREFERQDFSDTFRGWSDIRQTRYILRELDDPQAPLARDILIETDPQFMVDFRNRVWPMVAQRCAGGNCHGGQRVVGSLRLFNVPGRNERVEYTNFALLDGLVADGARMIDRDRPEESLLLQYLLPEDQAQNKHPTRLTPAFPSRRSGGYRRVETWIRELRGPPHPRYELEYDPPFGMSLQFRSLPSVLRRDRATETQPSE